MSLTTPQQFPLLSPSLDLHPQPFPGTDKFISTPASISALQKQYLTKWPGASIPDLCLTPDFSCEREVAGALSLL